MDNSTHQKEVRFRLSSKHIILASPYFKTMLGGPWREADELELEADDWDTEALLIIMRVIHGQNQHVPRLIKLELLAKIAVLVDYYECRDAIDLAAEIWIKQLTPPEEPSKDLVFWLLISWVFRREEIFRAITTIALRQSQGPLQAFNLPIPESILSKYREPPINFPTNSRCRADRSSQTRIHLRHCYFAQGALCRTSV